MSTQFFFGVDLAKHHFSLHAVDDEKKVAIIACMRKMLVILDSMLRVGIKISPKFRIDDILFCYIRTQYIELLYKNDVSMVCQIRLFTL
ncbi:hypothetical protein [Salinivibrio kushneri]|uniref:hypothetical protein n=1 Tax=Salinivibrio kushneri TaxID=1908198 RepID=UPI00138FA401|nr:hypothetical protein [Salinivibrio kushneri]